MPRNGGISTQTTDISTVNFIPNPSFEYDSNGSHTLTGWTLNNANTVQTVSNTYAKFGTQSLMISPTGSTNNYMYVDVPFGANETWMLSFYVMCTAYTSGQFHAAIKDSSFNDYNDFTIPSTVGIGTWTRYSLNITHGPLPGAGKVRVIFDWTVSTPVYTYYLDGVQWERLPSGTSAATTYCDGSLGYGNTWSGTANNSTSTRKSRKLAT